MEYIVLYINLIVIATLSGKRQKHIICHKILQFILQC